MAAAAQQNFLGFLPRLSAVEWRVPKDRWVLLILILVAVFMRLPYFFLSSETRLWRYEMLYHDEALFLMHGRDVLNGHLPYIHHWDNRPPMSWFLFAIFNFLSGENLAVFRALGALHVALTGFVLFKLFAAHGRRGAGLLAGCFYAVFCSVAQVGQSITTEHVISFFFALLLYFLLCGKAYKYQRAAIGFLFAICVMTLTNFLVMAPAVALLMPGADGKAFSLPGFAGNGLRRLKQEFVFWFKNMVQNSLVVLGMLGFCYGALYSLYWINDQHEFLIRSLVDGAFVVSRQPMDERLLTQFGYRWQGFSTRFFYSYVYSAEWLLPLLVGVFLTRAISALFEPAAVRDNLSIKLMLLMVFASLALFFRGGNFWNFPYYLLQMMPLAALGMARATSMKMRDLRLVMLVVVINGLQVATNRVLSNYKPLMEYARGKNEYSYMFMNDRLYQVARELNRFPIAGKYMLVCTEDDALYILTHTENPRYFIFPAFTGYHYLARTLGVRIEPFYEVVKRAEPVALIGWRGDKCFTMAGDLLSKHYELYSSVQNLHVYLRKELLVRARGGE